MTAPHRHLTLLAALCLASCTSLPTAPEPAEFNLSSDELRQQSKATRSLGIVELYADSINSSQDEKGETFHLATGNVLLVKRSSPPIQAKASEILLNSSHAEVNGLSVVKKQNQLFFGESDTSKILIDGVQIRPKGRHSIKSLSKTPPKQKPETAEEVKPEPAAVTQEVKPIAPVPEVKPTPAPKPQPKRKAKATAPKTKPVSNPTPKPTTPKPPSPTVDRAKLLQLMREPEN
jgi:hypothetical protein